jgi:hypothetical protein
VVTSFRYRLHPLSTVLGGAVAYPLAAGQEVIDTYRRVTHAAPDALSVQLSLLTGPDHSTKVAGVAPCHCRDLDEAKEDVRLLREVAVPIVNAVAPMSYPDQNRRVDARFPRGALHYWKSAFFTELSDAAGAHPSRVF